MDRKNTAAKAELYTSSMIAPDNDSGTAFNIDNLGGIGDGIGTLDGGAAAA